MRMGEPRLHRAYDQGLADGKAERDRLRSIVRDLAAIDLQDADTVIVADLAPLIEEAREAL